MSTAAPSFHWTSASRSHPGHVRAVNEDSYLDCADRRFWAVADGMGGHTMGDLASNMAVRALTDLPTGDELEQRVAATLKRLDTVNRILRGEAQRRKVPLIGTTIAALIAGDSRCCCLWAGDSCIYRYRAGRLAQLTRDHSHLAEAHARQVSSEDDTVVRPRANMITRALGAEDMLRIEQLTVDLLDGDVFLLCTDGLSNEVNEASMLEMLRPGVCSAACQGIVNLALATEARDNLTAVVVCAEDLSSPERTLRR